MGMSAITIVEAITNSKSPRQQQAAVGKTLVPFRLREIIIHEQFEDREKKLVSAIPAGLKCETRNSCACRPFTTLSGTSMRSFSTMSVTSVMLLLHCPARI
jgi:hypothetical protein